MPRFLFVEAAHPGFLEADTRLSEYLSHLESAPTLDRPIAPLWCILNPLESTFVEALLSVDYKALARKLSPLESAVTENRGGEVGVGESVQTGHIPDRTDREHP